MHSVVYNDPKTLANHIQYVLDTNSPVRVHKSLYLIFGIYSAIYSDIPEFPELLFEESFEAWRFGPVLRSIYLDNLDGQLSKTEWHPQNDIEDEIASFIGDVLDSINRLDDFQLVDRVHQDNAWISAYIDTDNPHDIGIMDHDLIKKDYMNAYPR